MKTSKFQIKYLYLILVILGISLFQTYSLYLNIDEKVDESELVYFAVGFFGGDLNPHWYGYGNIVMYFLSLLYLIVFPIKAFLFEISSLDEYSKLLFSSDYFINLGRFIFSIIGVVTLYIYLNLIKKYSQSIFFPIVLGIVFLTSYDSIYYSNYIRLDQIVALFVGIIIYLTLNLSKKNYYYLSMSIGAIVATKISTLAVGAVFLYSSIILLKNKEITKKDFIFASFLILCIIQFTQPYNNLLEFFNLVSSQNTVENLTFFLKLSTLYSTVKVNILENINNYLLYSLFLLPFAIKYYTKAVFISISLFFLLILPYLAGTGTTRNYWLIANYDIVYFLIGLSLLGFYKFSLKFSKSFQRALILIFILSSFYIIYLNLLQYNQILLNYKFNISNQKIAKQWIEQNLIQDSNNKIFMDMHKNYNLPRIYNKNDISISEKVTRNFIYNRMENEYLRKIFAQYINEDYVRKVDNKYKKLNLLRIDPLCSINNNIVLSDLKFYYKNKNISFKIIKTNNITNLVINESNITFDSIGNDPYLVLELEDEIYLDDTFNLTFNLENNNNDKIFVFYDSGNGFSSFESISKNYQSNIFISIKDIKKENNYAQVLPLYASEINDEYKGKLKNSYFVTSPSIYKSFIGKSTFKQGHVTVDTPKALDLHYRYLTSFKIYKKFNTGYGDIIEIYRID